MPLYKIENHYGGAVVGGINKRVALEQLKRHEDYARNGTHVSLALKEEDLTEVFPDTKGVVLYFSNE